MCVFMGDRQRVASCVAFFGLLLSIITSYPKETLRNFKTDTFFLETFLKHCLQCNKKVICFVRLFLTMVDEEKACIS